MLPDTVVIGVETVPKLLPIAAVQPATGTWALVELVAVAVPAVKLKVVTSGAAVTFTASVVVVLPQRLLTL